MWICLQQQNRQNLHEQISNRVGVKFFYIKHYEKDIPRSKELCGDINSKVCLHFLSLTLQSCHTVSISFTCLSAIYSTLLALSTLIFHQQASAPPLGQKVILYTESWHCLASGYGEWSEKACAVWIRVHLSIVGLTSFPWFYIDLPGLYAAFCWFFFFFFCFLVLILIGKVSSLSYLVTEQIVISFRY